MAAATSTKKIGGALKDKLLITTTRVTYEEIPRAILKTTSHKLKEPNEKHLGRLVAASRGQYDSEGGHSMEDIVGALEKRLHVRDWVVVLKTLLTLHRLRQAGTSRIRSAMDTFPSLFNVTQTIKDLADSPEGRVQSRLIVEYGRYLEERTKCEACCGYQLEYDTFSRDLSYGPVVWKEVKAATTALDALLQALVAIKMDSTYTGDNVCSRMCFDLVRQDSSPIYAGLTSRVVWLLDTVGHLSDEGRADVLQTFKQYTTRCQELVNTYNQMRSNHLEGVPELQQIPPELVQNLEDTNAKTEESDDDEVAVLPLDSILGEKPSTLTDAPSPGVGEANAGAASPPVDPTPPADPIGELLGL